MTKMPEVTDGGTKEPNILGSENSAKDAAMSNAKRMNDESKLRPIFILFYLIFFMVRCLELLLKGLAVIQKMDRFCALNPASVTALYGSVEYDPAVRRLDPIE